MRFAAAASIVCMLVLAPARANTPQGGPLDALLARVRVATGRPYAHHVVSTSTQTEDGRAYDVRSESDGYRFVVRRCRDVVCAGPYFDGERAYAVDANDTALPADLHEARELRTLRAIATAAFASPDFRGDGGALTDLGTVERDGKALRRIAVAATGSPPLDVLIDTDRAVAVAVADADGSVVDEYRDFRTVDGLTLPFEIVHRGSQVERFAARGVSGEPLAVPAGMVPAFRGAEQVVMHKPDPARNASAGQPVVPCTLGGAAVLCLIDTGNSGLGISLELSERLNLEPSGEYEVNGVGRYVTGLVTAGPLHVGSATYGRAKYVVLTTCTTTATTSCWAPTRWPTPWSRSTTVARRSRSPPATRRRKARRFRCGSSIRTGGGGAVGRVRRRPRAGYRRHCRGEHLASVLCVASGPVRAPGQPSDQRHRRERQSARQRDLQRADRDLRSARQPIAATGTAAGTGDGHLGGAFLSHFTLVLDYARARVGLAPNQGDAAMRAVP